MAGISKEKLDLVTRFIVPVEGQGIQIRIGEKEDHIASFFGIPHAQ